MSPSAPYPLPSFEACLLAAAALPELPAFWLSGEMRILSANPAGSALMAGASAGEPGALRLVDCMDEQARGDFEAFWEEWLDSPVVVGYPLDCRRLGRRQADLIPWGENALVLLRASTEAQVVPLLNPRLIQSQKMETIGRLAGGLAHSLNNTLMGVIGYCELAMMDVEQGHPVRFHLETIKEIGEKASQLSRQLLAYSRKQHLHLDALSLGGLIRDMEPMLHHWLGQKAWLKTVLEDRRPVSGDRGQLEQVIMNLVFNARDAMPEDGRLSLCTRDIEVDEGLAQAFPGLRPGSYGLLQVLDRGCGMSEEVLANIFEPFYTTKGYGKGTGLGLATVYGVIKQHRGYIGVASEPGQGSSFSLLLPRGETDGDSAAPSVPNLGGRHFLVLGEERRWTHYLAAALRAAGGEAYVGWTGIQHWRRSGRGETEPVSLLVDEALLRTARERLAAAGLELERLPVLVFSGLASQASVARALPGTRLPKLIATVELYAVLERAAPLPPALLA